MSKKEKILAKLSEQRKGLKKVNLSLIGDLQNDNEAIKSIDLQNVYDLAFTDYEFALGKFEEAQRSVEEFIGSFDRLSDAVDNVEDLLISAGQNLSEIKNQLDSLGIEPNAEINMIEDELRESETMVVNARQDLQSFQYNRLERIID